MRISIIAGGWPISMPAAARPKLIVRRQALTLSNRFCRMQPNCRPRMPKDATAGRIGRACHPSYPYMMARILRSCTEMSARSPIAKKTISIAASPFASGMPGISLGQHRLKSISPANGCCFRVTSGPVEPSIVRPPKSAAMTM